MSICAIEISIQFGSHLVHRNVCIILRSSLEMGNMGPHFPRLYGGLGSSGLLK